MRQEFARRGNPVDTCGRSYGSLSVDRTWEYCRSSAIGEVRKDVAQGWTSAESQEGHSWYELWLEGYFIPNTSLPTSEFEFRMKEVWRNFYSRSCPLQFCARSPSEILAFNACMPESFQIRAIRRDFLEFPLERNPKRHTIMIPSAVNHMPR